MEAVATTIVFHMASARRTAVAPPMGIRNPTASGLRTVSGRLAMTGTMTGRLHLHHLVKAVIGAVRTTAKGAATTAATTVAATAAAPLASTAATVTSKADVPVTALIDMRSRCRLAGMALQFRDGIAVVVVVVVIILLSIIILPLPPTT